MPQKNVILNLVFSRLSEGRESSSLRLKTVSLFGFITGTQFARLDHIKGAVNAEFLKSSAGAVMGRLKQDDLNNVVMAQMDGVDLLWAGRLDNFHELRSEFSCRGSTFNEVLPELIIRHGQTCIAKMVGEFVFATWNGTKQELEIYRDRIGVKPIYFAQIKEGLAFATQAKVILKITGMEIEPDPIGIAGHLTSTIIDQFAYGRTCFKNIEALPPAHSVRWSPGQRVKLVPYWDFSYNKALEKMDFQEATKEFARLFHQSVSRRSQVRTAVSVSGGLDSSSILCSILSHRAPSPFPPIGISYYSKRAEVDETKFLNDIEVKYGFLANKIDMDLLSGIMPSLKEQVLVAEAPFVDYLWRTTKSTMTSSRDLGAQALLTGHFGDQLLFNWSYLVDLINQGQFITAYKHLREFSNWYEEDISAIAMRQIPKQLLRSWIPKSLVPSFRAMWRRTRRNPEALIPILAEEKLTSRPAHFNPDRFPTAQSRSMYSQVRSRYHLQCLDWYAKVSAHTGVDVGFPMFDLNLLEFLVSLPGHLQNHNGIPRAILREALRDVLPPSIADRTWKSDFSNVVCDNVEQEFSDLQEGLFSNPRLIEAGFSGKDELARIIEHYSTTLSGENCTSAWGTVDLAALNFWLELYWHKRANKGDDSYEEVRKQKVPEAHS